MIRGTFYVVEKITKDSPNLNLVNPRLELCEALLASDLLEVISEQLEGKFTTYHLWCNFGVVLAWIQKPPTKLKTFVGHRVALTQSKTIAFGYEWHWVAGDQIPADLASRGVSPQTLKKEKIWWSGPTWLQLEKENWPKSE